MSSPQKSTNLSCSKVLQSLITMLQLEVYDASLIHPTLAKTCSYCGKIHKIGSKKTMKCDCGANVDRDLNGARGIYLRALAVTPSLS